MKTANLAIYNPKGAAAEYATWACNLYNGCVHGCVYCYCKRGILKNTLGGDKPEIKKQLGGSQLSAYRIFSKELEENADRIRREGGLFFSFSTDPMIREEWTLTYMCMRRCFFLSVPVVILTKSVDWWKIEKFRELFIHYRHLVAIGFTLTGHDELEPGAATNEQRLDLMKTLSADGMNVWASIEPVIDTGSALTMILRSTPYCRHFKIGLRSGVRRDYYNKRDLYDFYEDIAHHARSNPQYGISFYLKDSFMERLNMDRSVLSGPFVGCDFKFFG